MNNRLKISLIDEEGKEITSSEISFELLEKLVSMHGEHMVKKAIYDVAYPLIELGWKKS